jgi:hypothetical protein
MLRCHKTKSGGLRKRRAWKKKGKELVTGEKRGSLGN